MVLVKRICIFPCLGWSKVKASSIWGVIRTNIKMHQNFYSKEFLAIIFQKQTLVQHQIYTWVHFIGPNSLEEINLPRGDTIHSMHYIYWAEGHRKTFLKPHMCTHGICLRLFIFRLIIMFSKCKLRKVTLYFSKLIDFNGII